MGMITAKSRSSFWLRLVPQRICSPADVTVQTVSDARHIGTLPDQAWAAVIPENIGAETNTGAVNVGVRSDSAEIEVKK